MFDFRENLYLVVEPDLILLRKNRILSKPPDPQPCLQAPGHRGPPRLDLPDILPGRKRVVHFFVLVQLDDPEIHVNVS